MGLIQGSVDQQRVQFTGDLIISTLNDKKYIENSPNIISLVRSLPEVEAVTPRYREGGVLEADYQTQKLGIDKQNTASGQVVGINPADEDAVTNITAHIIDGAYLTADDYDKVIIGSFLLKQYVPVNNPGFSALENVRVGSKIRLTIGKAVREVTVKAILKTKVQDIARNVYMVDTQLRSMIGRADGNVAEISVKVKEGIDPAVVRDELVRRGVDKTAKVQTYLEAQPQALKDIVATFNMLGTAFSSIGLVVSSVTIFIVIFINALTRRKYIGILKGIGIHGRAIEISYLFQSIFYAICGSAIGLFIVYGILVPFIAAHPINFPFSDGILVAPVGQTMFRVFLLIFSTVVAGFIPAWMIIRRNTLDSILGRN